MFFEQTVELGTEGKIQIEKQGIWRQREDPGSFDVPQTTTDVAPLHTIKTEDSWMLVVIQLFSSVGSDNIPAMSNVVWLDSLSHSSVHQIPCANKVCVMIMDVDNSFFSLQEEEHPFTATDQTHFSKHRRKEALTLRDSASSPVIFLDEDRVLGTSDFSNTSSSCSGDVACNEFHSGTDFLPYTQIFGSSSAQKPASVNSKYEQSSYQDKKRARALKLPISNEDIINLPFDEFKEHLSKYELTEAQLSLIRGIRKRGRNKVSSHKSRKRKLHEIYSLQRDVDGICAERDREQAENERLLLHHLDIHEKYSQLYNHVLRHMMRRNPQSVPELPDFPPSPSSASQWEIEPSSSS